MGFLRGFAKGIAGFFFLILVSGLLMNITLYESTKSEFLKPVFVTLIFKSLETQNIDSFYSDASDKCQSQTSYVMPMGDMNITIDCSKITSQEEFSKVITEALFDQQMYNRPCSGADCLQMKDIPGFATKGFNLFLKDTLIIIGGLTMVFGLFLFLLSKGWSAKFSSLGVPFIINGIGVIPLMIFKQKIAIGDLQFFSEQLIEIMTKYMLLFLALGIVFIIFSILTRSKQKIKKGKKTKDNKKKRKK